MKGVESKSNSLLLSNNSVPTHVSQAFKVHSFRNWYGGLVLSSKDLEKVTSIDLGGLLTHFFQSLGDKDPLSLLDDLAQIIPIEKLEELVAKNFKEYDRLATMQKLLASAKSCLEKVKAKPTPAISAYLSQFLDSLISIFESIIGAFGIADFLKPAESEIQTDFKFQRVMMQITLFTMLLSALIPVIGPIDAITYVGGSFSSIWLLSVIYPHCRPSPSHLPKSVNWSKEVGLCKLSCPGERVDKLQEISEALILARKDKKHVMLLGESGVGKTETLKALTHAIARGDYPELQGLKIFYFNTANLVNSTEILGGGNKIIDHIKREGGKHLKQCVLIFDEIALACRDQAILGDQLKTELDNADGQFATVIGVTTQMEFDRDILTRNPAFARRFIQIKIDSTDKVETLQVMDNYLQRESPISLIEDDALGYIYDTTKHAIQPAMALNILSQCVKKSASKGISRNKPVSQQVVLSSSLFPLASSNPKKEPSSDFIQPKDDQILFNLRKKIFEYKMKVFKQTVGNKGKDPTQLKKIFLINLLVENLALRAKGTKLFIDKALINETIQEEETRQKEIADAIARGKTQNKDDKKT